MSFGGDEYDEQGRTGGEGPSARRRSARRATRLRLPGEDGDVYGTGRRGGSRPGRSLLTVVTVVVLLVAAIAFANREGGGPDGGERAEDGPRAEPTAASGTTPVSGSDGASGVPSGFAQSEQGAASAAANFAVALGGDRMFARDSREAVVDAVYTPDTAAKVKARSERAYSPEVLESLGLDAEGNAPEGQTFVSRTVPVGTEVRTFSDSDATVAVWYTGLIGMAGGGSENPVRTTWQTWTFELVWTGSDWRIARESQKDGPAPVPGDVPAAGAEEISKAVEQFGGFTYAR
jgi:hypothetical protein